MILTQFFFYSAGADGIGSGHKRQNRLPGHIIVTEDGVDVVAETAPIGAAARRRRRPVSQEIDRDRCHVLQLETESNHRHYHRSEHRRRNRRLRTVHRRRLQFHEVSGRSGKKPERILQINGELSGLSALRFIDIIDVTDALHILMFGS